MTKLEVIRLGSAFSAASKSSLTPSPADTEDDSVGSLEVPLRISVTLGRQVDVDTRPEDFFHVARLNHSDHLELMREEQTGYVGSAEAVVVGDVLSL